MIDQLFKEYELNEKYHDTKENRTWIAGALHLTYSLLFIQWLMQPDSQGAVYGYRWLIIVFITLLDVSIFLFVVFQLQRKAHSVKRAAKLKYAIVNAEQNKDKSVWSTIVWKNEIASNDNLKGYFPGWLSLYKIEIPLLFAMFLLYSVKIYFIIERRAHRRASGISILWPQLLVLAGIALVVGLISGLTISHLIDRRNRKVLSNKNNNLSDTSTKGAT